MRALSPSPCLCPSPCLLSLAGLVALPATADEGWSVAPLGTGRPYFSAAGTPGTVVQDTLPVRKPTTRHLNVRVTDSSWLTRAAPGIDAPARTRADLPCTVRVPDGTPPGARTATISARASGRTGTVRVRGGGPRLPALTAEHVTVRGDRIAYELVNRGTTGLAPTLAVHALTVPAADGTVRDEAGASVRFLPWGGVVLWAGGALGGVRRLRRRTRDEPPCERAELATETGRLTGAMT
ncbi:hypothetical protein ADL01_33245 [Streptomyces sp. NRRL WC-3618]|uniref:hypothetical protein n=1 Tax=Streptomyces sp. NRRL WC-3618 TaxID=1519490 RepID=UPI0006ADB12B|nr:hypothetical protein [Streptomyces sp. NRRL WC-3618]KOV60340.1 hypothetical protein ADL01_33245 [Streptomyces sp. NRRL WC-3618]